MRTVEISINSNFFQHPKDISLFKEFEPTLTLWLKVMGLDQYQAYSFQNHIKNEFPLALNEIWNTNSERYTCIENTLDSPFNISVHDALAWEQYSYWLQKQANKRVFGEAFGLRDVYIPLRAYYETKKKKTSRRHACELHTFILEWLCKFDKKDSLKVISGGPGSGKSSFSKILAAEIIEQRIARVLHIPLHRFKLENNLIEAIDDFINNNRYLKNNPLHQDYKQDRLILIFDGLDELSEQGHEAKKASNQFINNLIREIDQKNDNDSQWQAVITGRDISIQNNQHNLKKQKQILHLLPYCISDDEITHYDSGQKLLNTDQCSIWWKKFAKAKGLPYKELPSELDTEDLFLIVREPLLNYLVALSYQRKKIDFTDSTSLNKIYYDLLSAVYERKYANNRQYTASKHLNFDEFLEVLEEIALAIWHDHGRTTSESYLLKRCKKAKIEPYFKDFAKSAKKGVIKLLTTFYFRKFDTHTKNERTFEFTHKSFGEYLTAKKLVKSALSISKKSIANKKDFNTSQALKKWVELTGPTLCNQNICNFINNEIAELNIKELDKVQTVFTQFLESVIYNRTPIGAFKDLSFEQILKFSTNSETAILIIHCACARQTTTKTRLTEDPIILSNWIQRVGHSDTFLSSCQYLDFQHYWFDYDNLGEINLSFSDLEGASLTNTNLSFANLKQTQLNAADLEGANLQSANLEKANLAFANLEYVNLESAYLKHADLEDAVLTNARLRTADLTEAFLANSNLSNANLIDCFLLGADLSYANLYQAKLINSDLCASNLQGATLDNANFTNSYLAKTNLNKASLVNSILKGTLLISSNLTEATLTGANLASANLTNADLTGALLNGANLSKANLKNANLTNTDLSGANLQDANLTGAITTGANLTGTILEYT